MADDEEEEENIGQERERKNQRSKKSVEPAGRKTGGKIVWNAKRGNEKNPKRQKG